MLKNKKLRTLTYIGALFVAGYSSLPAYINSSFLKNFLSEEGIGWLYVFTSLVSIILMAFAPWIIRRFGNVKILLWLAVCSFLAVIPLIFPFPRLFILTIFCLYIILGYAVRYILDVYLENVSDDKDTGSIRGIYMTFYNFAWLVSPFIAAYLISDGNYNLVYGCAGILLIPLILICLFGLRENNKTKYGKKSIWQELKNIWKTRKTTGRNIYNILAIDLLLNFFYAIMVVYMPLYLYNHIGLTWPEIGLTFTIMLLPFVLFELPLGKIADRFFGEKEILIGGLAIASLATMACTFLKTPDWFLWAILLFLTRTGAAAIEIMKETYLFKKISSANTGIISISRVNVPLSYLLGPAFVSLVLMVLDFKYIFLLLGLIILFGLRFAWKLQDTK